MPLHSPKPLYVYASTTPTNQVDSAQSDSVDNVPFALVTHLFATLRAVGSSSVATAHPRPGSSRADAATRRGHLTRFWLDAATHTATGRESLRTRSATTALVPAHVLSPRDGLRLVALLVPSLDPVHVYLGMKETRLADAFRRALDLAPGHPHAVWLVRYKERAVRPHVFRDDPSIVDGSLPSVLRAVLADRCAHKSALSVGDVWHALDVLSSTFRVRTRRIARVAVVERPGEGDAVAESSVAMEERRSDALRLLISNGTADDVAEIARIILKDADVRVSVDAFLNWFHPSARQHYAQVHDVNKLLKDCHDPLFDIADAAVAPGQFASVMLCMRPSRKNLPAICQKLRGDGDGQGGELSNATDSGGAAVSGAARAEEASRPESAGDAAAAAKEKAYFIMEPKLDGERLQLHKWKTDDVAGSGAEDGNTQTTSSASSDAFVLKTYSRRGNDSSAMYANALQAVVQTAVRARDIILDGEVIIWDDAKATWLPFEQFRDVTTKVAERNVAAGSQYVLKYMVFDVLYVNQGGRSKRGLNAAASKRAAAAIMRLPLYKRRLILDRLIRPTEQTWCPGARVGIELVRAEHGRTEAELTMALQRYEALGYEGVIGKNPDKPYVLGERSLELAIKLKPDYFDGGIQDIDAIILGGKYSTSRGHRVERAGDISTFLIGVRADDAPIPHTVASHQGNDANADTTRTKWVPIGSVGSGYSDTQLGELRAKLEGAWRTLDRRNLPDHLEVRGGSTMLQQVAVWIAPRDSVVLTVRAFELNRKLCALRFARVQRIRWDKDWRDAATFGDVLDADDAKTPAVVRADAHDVDDVVAAITDSDGRAPSAKRRRRNVASSASGPAQHDAQDKAALAAARADGHVVSGGRAARAVMATVRGADVRGVAVVCDALDGVVACVVGSDAARKHATERRIHELGGRFVQVVTAEVDTVIVAAGSASGIGSGKGGEDEGEGEGQGNGKGKDKDGSARSAAPAIAAAAETASEAIRRVDAADRTAQVSILRAAWIDACFATRQRVDPSGRDVVRASHELSSRVFSVTDRFGDAWSSATTVASFRQAAAAVAEWREQQQQQQQQQQLKQKLKQKQRRSGRRDEDNGDADGDGAKGSDVGSNGWAEAKSRTEACARECGLVFRGMVVFEPRDLGVRARGAAALMRALGAREARRLGAGVTHVLVHSSVEAEWRAQRAEVETADVVTAEVVTAEVVTEAWVLEQGGAGRSGRK